MKRLFFFSILWVAVLLLPGVSVLAQTEQKVRGAKAWEIRGLNHDSIIAAFGRRFVVLDSLMRSDVEVDRALLFADTPHMQQVDSAFEAKEAYERKAFKRKHGLELTGQAYYRLDDQLGFDEDDQYSRYKAKFQGELGWNLFNSSFLQRKPQLRLISLNNQADRLHHLRQNARPLWDDAREAIEQRYNRLTAAVLREQLRAVQEELGGEEDDAAEYRARMEQKALHTIEHIGATILRNGRYKDGIIYFGPMGCRTGFYLLTYGLNHAQVLEMLKDCFKRAQEFTEIPGSRREECGNYSEHDLEGAKRECAAYAAVLEKL